MTDLDQIKLWRDAIRRDFYALRSLLDGIDKLLLSAEKRLYELSQRIDDIEARPKAKRKK